MYHGCNFRNRNGTKTLIDYARGQWCPLETDEYSCKTAKSKYLFKKNYYTRKIRRELLQVLCLCYCCRDPTIERLSKGKVVTLQESINEECKNILRDKFGLLVYGKHIGDLTA